MNHSIRYRYHTQSAKCEHRKELFENIKPATAVIPDIAEQNSFGKDAEQEANPRQSEINELKQDIAALLSVKYLCHRFAR